MKKIITVATVLISLSGPTQAEEGSANGVTGFVQFNLDHTNTDTMDSSYAYSPWRGIGFETAVGYDLMGGRSSTVELTTFSRDTKIGKSDNYGINGALAAAHMNWELGAGTVGGFGGLLSHNDYVYCGNDLDFVAGVEAKTLRSNNIIVDGQIAVINQISGYYEMGLLTNTSVGVQYFPQENLLLGARLGYLSGQIGDDDGEDARATRWTLEAAYKPDALPVSFFADVSRLTDNVLWGKDDDGALTASLGVRWAFDGASIKTQSLQLNRVADLSSVSWLRNDSNW